jgi:hypothetical protein
VAGAGTGERQCGAWRSRGKKELSERERQGTEEQQAFDAWVWATCAQVRAVQSSANLCPELSNDGAITVIFPIAAL